MRNVLKLKMCWIYHITSYRVFELRASKRSKKMRKKLNFLQKWKKDLDWSDNDFLHPYFFCATLSFWDIVNFNNDCVPIFQLFLPTNYSQKWCLSHKMPNILIGVFVILICVSVRFLVFELWYILYFTVVNSVLVLVNSVLWLAWQAFRTWFRR